MEWLQERAAQNDAELKSLKGELTQAYQQIEREYSLAREKDEHLLALKIEAHDLKSVIENVKAEKEAAEHRIEQVTMELSKMVEAQEAQEKRVKVCFLLINCRSRYRSCVCLAKCFLHIYFTYVNVISVFLIEIWRKPNIV